MFFAVPITLRIADSTLSVLRSGSLISAISCNNTNMSCCCATQQLINNIHTFTFAMVTLPTLVLLGEPEPVSMPAACLSSTDAGGVLRIKVKLRSCTGDHAVMSISQTTLQRASYTVISTGMMVPALSCVAALYSLQNCIMLTPLAPSAGPTGGAGLALPAASASLIMPVTVGRRV